MRRMFWVAVGAVGGIYAYRHGARLRDQLEREGLLRTAMSVGDDAAAAVGTTRSAFLRVRTLLVGSGPAEASWPAGAVTVVSVTEPAPANTPKPATPPTNK